MLSQREDILPALSLRDAQAGRPAAIWEGTVGYKECDWEYDTSNEESTSIALITGAAGKLFFINPETDEHLEFKYSILSVGASKGGAVNVAKSVATSSSGGFTKVQVRSGHLFNKHKFPCNGVVIATGVTAGVFAPSFINDAGIQAAFLGFGGNLFAWVPVWGLFSAALPSAGVSVGLLSCETATSYKTVPDVTNPNVG
jgi:hypothetical protein